MKRIFSFLVALSLLLLTAAHALAASDFYAGKKIRLIVSCWTGGGNDTYSRLLARHMSKKIPGNPTFVVQNMPGAGGLVASDYLYRRARRDGTVMEQIQWGVWNYQAVKDKRAKFDFNKMNAIGAIVLENAVFYTRTDRYKSIEAIIKSGKKATVGVSGRQSTGYVVGNIIESILGVKIFEYVLGYPGARQYSLALRQGELDASSNTYSSFLDQLGDMLKSGDLVVVAQSGTLEGKREPTLPDTPLLKELATTPEGREIADASFVLAHYGRPYALPPGVPKERVKLLREAFLETVNDPKFRAEAKRLKRPVDPLSGQQLQDMWKSDLNPPPKKLKIVKTIFGGKKK
jgi:tripartite-type tricarboxylate transporter receptor subunit TctC